MTTVTPARRSAIEHDPAGKPIPTPATRRRVAWGGRGPGQQPPSLPVWLRGEQRHGVSRPGAVPVVQLLRQAAGQPETEVMPRHLRAPWWLIAWRYLRRSSRAARVALAGDAVMASWRRLVQRCTRWLIIGLLCAEQVLGVVFLLVCAALLVMVGLRST